MPVVSHDEKSHGVPHFDCLDLRNSMAAFTVSLASCDADANVGGVT